MQGPAKRSPWACLVAWPRSDSGPQQRGGGPPSGGPEGKSVRPPPLVPPHGDSEGDRPCHVGSSRWALSALTAARLRVASCRHPQAPGVPSSARGAVGRQVTPVTSQGFGVFLTPLGVLP